MVVSYQFWRHESKAIAICFETTTWIVRLIGKYRYFYRYKYSSLLVAGKDLLPVFTGQIRPEWAKTEKTRPCMPYSSVHISAHASPIVVIKGTKLVYISRTLQRLQLFVLSND